MSTVRGSTVFETRRRYSFNADDGIDLADFRQMA